MRTWLWGILVVTACKHTDKKAEPPPALKVAAVADAGAPAKKKPAPTKQQLADYKKHMKAGWALQKDQKWAESVPELEAALKAIDGDQRALTELGWSAMNAGDYVKARKADDEAVKVAFDPKVKAAALFNLGTVYAKTGATDKARAAYALSLALRPNKTVEAELVKLGKQAEADKPLCTPTEDACTCLRKDAFGDLAPDDDQPTCEPADIKLPVPAFKAYAVHQGPWTYTYILDEHQSLVEELTQNDRARVYEESGVQKAELRTVGGHQILWLQTSDEATQMMPRDDDNMDSTDDTTIAVTLCVVGDAKTPTTCPVRDIPIEHTYSSEVMSDDGSASGHKESATKTDVALADDGTATVKLVSGPSDEHLNALIGPHKLW